MTETLGPVTIETEGSRTRFRVPSQGWGLVAGGALLALGIAALPLATDALALQLFSTFGPMFAVSIGLALPRASSPALVRPAQAVTVERAAGAETGSLSVDDGPRWHDVRNVQVGLARVRRTRSTQVTHPVFVVLETRVVQVAELRTEQLARALGARLGDALGVTAHLDPVETGPLLGATAQVVLGGAALVPFFGALHLMLRALDHPAGLALGMQPLLYAAAALGWALALAVVAHPFVRASTNRQLEEVFDIETSA